MGAVIAIIIAGFGISYDAGRGIQEYTFHGRPVPHQCRNFEESQRPMNKPYCDMWTKWAMETPRGQ